MGKTTGVEALQGFFSENNKIALAFSGGVDSSYLLLAAKAAGADIAAYYVRSQFQPEFEYRDACEIAESLGAGMNVIQVDVLSDPVVVSNPADRCYYCKRNIMGAVTSRAASDGYDLVIDGTNASDDADDRPGFRALREYGVRSPLRECGLTKGEIRSLLKEAGMPVFRKPAYACLATRIASGEEITPDKLRITERAESIIYDMGFRDFRVRMRETETSGLAALVQVTADQYEEAERRFGEIRDALSGMYSEIRLDANTR